MMGSNCPAESQVKFDQIASPRARMVNRNRAMEADRAACVGGKAHQRTVALAFKDARRGVIDRKKHWLYAAGGCNRRKIPGASRALRSAGQRCITFPINPTSSSL